MIDSHMYIIVGSHQCEKKKEKIGQCKGGEKIKNKVIIIHWSWMLNDTKNSKNKGGFYSTL